MSGVVVNILTRLGIIGAVKGNTPAAEATVSAIDDDHNGLDVVVGGALPLPTGAATSTLQTAGNTSLATLAGIVSTGRALVTEASAADILTAISAMSGKLPASLGYKAAAASLSIIFGAPTPTISATIPTTGLVVKGTPGVALWISTTNNTGGSNYVHVYDLASGPPANGARAAWASSAIIANGATRPGDIIGGTFGLGCANGILVIMSASPVTYSAVASANASASVQSY